MERRQLLQRAGAVAGLTLAAGCSDRVGQNERKTVADDCTGAVEIVEADIDIVEGDPLSEDGERIKRYREVTLNNTLDSQVDYVLKMEYFTDAGTRVYFRDHENFLHPNEKVTMEWVRLGKPEEFNEIDDYEMTIESGCPSSPYPITPGEPKPQ